MRWIMPGSGMRAKTLGDITQRKTKEPKVDRRRVKGISYQCKKGEHSCCVSMSCQCSCNHPQGAK